MTDKDTRISLAYCVLDQLKIEFYDAIHAYIQEVQSMYGDAYDYRDSVIRQLRVHYRRKWKENNISPVKMPLYKNLRIARKRLLLTCPFTYPTLLDCSEEVTVPTFRGRGEYDAHENCCIHQSDEVIREAQEKPLYQDPLTLKDRILLKLIASFPVFLNYEDSFSFDLMYVGDYINDVGLPHEFIRHITKLCKYLVLGYPINSRCFACHMILPNISL